LLGDLLLRVPPHCLIETAYRPADVKDNNDPTPLRSSLLNGWPKETTTRAQTNYPSK